MSVKLSKARHYLFLIAICLTNVIIMNDMVVMPVVNAFYELFPENTGGVNFVVSGPMAFGLAASLIAPYVIKWVNKKTTLVIACAAFACASIFGGSIVSLPYIITVRAICGFCYGIVQVVALDIVTEYFIDENKRASFMGIYNASMTAIGTVMGLVAGNLAVSGWQNVYNTYLIAVPMLIMVIFFVPKFASAVSEPNEEGASVSAPEAEEEAPMGMRFWIMLVNCVLLNICYAPFMMMISVYVAENNLGNEAFSGLVSSAGTVGSAVCCLAFGLLYNKLKARASLVSFGVMTAGLLALNLLPNKAVLLAASALVGGAYGMYFSYTYSQAPAIVAPQNISKAISYITAGCSLGCFAGTYVITFLMGMIWEPTVTAVCLVLGIILAVVSAVEFMNTGKMMKE